MSKNFQISEYLVGSTRILLNFFISFRCLWFILSNWSATVLSLTLPWTNNAEENVKEVEPGVDEEESAALANLVVHLFRKVFSSYLLSSGLFLNFGVFNMTSISVLVEVSSVFVLLEKISDLAGAAIVGLAGGAGSNS